MNILLIYPKTDKQTKGFSALFQQFLKHETEEPRELIEVSIQLPITWERKLVDLNQEKLDSKLLQWADYIVIKAGLKQRSSTLRFIDKCKHAGKKIIAEGELFDAQPNDFEDVDHLILNQTTFEPFVRDVESNSTKHIYSSLFIKEPLLRSAYSLMGFSGYFSRNIHTFSA
ncbi:hypothetical protein SLH46_00530 [Draconibacterium sp. IB214405]|uniref:hypothetical protein n=1 Tax=Draconibacterium sp. IB214405 TaxID=3097352 RepID=UPI002A0EA8B5|nr:hypothetical protein [Draconibacterium sp. IB214405]MDX8337645.1 hypothetical protein [Draconibacterium sp. IB214405]